MAEKRETFKKKMKTGLRISCLALCLSLMTVSLTSCEMAQKIMENSLNRGNGTESAEETVEQVAEHPVGIYKMLYYSMDDGKYLDELNLREDSSRYVEYNIVEYMEEMGIAWYFDIREDGTGDYYAMYAGEQMSGVPVTFEFEKERFTDGKSLTREYRMEDDRFWFENDGGIYVVFGKTTQDEIDRILAGKAGSVPLAEARVGDLVCLGIYEQNPAKEGMEPIFWRVIDEKDGQLFLLSEKLLDSFAYNTNPEEKNLGAVTWENSSLRKFLNNDFLDACFTEDEVALIQTTHLKNESYNDYLAEVWNFDQAPYSEMAVQNHADGPETDDKVFLLSLGDVLQYLGEEEEETDPLESYPFNTMHKASGRVACITPAIAAAGSGYYDDETWGGAWNTRTLSDPGNMAVYVTGDGMIFHYFTYGALYIRPAMWVNRK